MIPYVPPRFQDQMFHRPRITRTRTLNGTGKFICPHCDRRCQSEHAMDNHVRVHTGEKPFPCMIPDCGKYFKQKSQQYSHMRNAHNFNTDLLWNQNYTQHPKVVLDSYATSNSQPTFIQTNSNKHRLNLALDPEKVKESQQADFMASRKGKELANTQSGYSQNCYSYVDKSHVAQTHVVQNQPLKKRGVENEVEQVYSKIKERTKKKYIKRVENEDILQPSDEEEGDECDLNVFKLPMLPQKYMQDSDITYGQYDQGQRQGLAGTTMDVTNNELTYCGGDQSNFAPIQQQQFLQSMTPYIHQQSHNLPMQIQSFQSPFCQPPLFNGWQNGMSGITQWMPQQQLYQQQVQGNMKEGLKQDYETMKNEIASIKALLAHQAEQYEDNNNCADDGSTFIFDVPTPINPSNQKNTNIIQPVRNFEQQGIQSQVLSQSQTQNSQRTLNKPEVQVEPPRKIEKTVQTSIQSYLSNSSLSISNALTNNPFNNFVQPQHAINLDETQQEARKDEIKELYPADLLKQIQEAFDKINNEYISTGLTNVKWYYDYNYYKNMKKPLRFR